MRSRRSEQLVIHPLAPSKPPATGPCSLARCCGQRRLLPCATVKMRCMWMAAVKHGKKRPKVLLVLTRPAEPGADPHLPPPSARRTAPRVEFLSPGSLWPEVLLHHNPRWGYAPPHPATAHGALTMTAGPERGGTPAPVHGREESQAPRPPDDHLCRWPPRQRSRPAQTH